MAAVVSNLIRLQDGPGALLCSDIHYRSDNRDHPKLEQVFDQAIVNLTIFIKCLMQRRVSKFCALSGPSQLCAFATASGSSFRIHGLARSLMDQKSLDTPPTLVSHPRSTGQFATTALIAGKLSTAGDALAECYSWLAVQQARLPIDVLFDKVQKTCEQIIRSSAFASPQYLWPCEELLPAKRFEPVLNQALTIASLHWFLSVLLRIIRRAHTFQIRQPQLLSIFAMLSKVTARVDWVILNLNIDSEFVPVHVRSRLLDDVSITSFLLPFKSALMQFSLTVRGLMIALSDKSSSRLVENSVFVSIVAQHAVYMLNWKPSPIYPSVVEAVSTYSDVGTSFDTGSERYQLPSSWCSLFLFSARIVQNAQESLFFVRNASSLSSHEIGSLRFSLEELLKSGSITRILEVWRWTLSVRQDIHRSSLSLHPWSSSNGSNTRASAKKSRKTKNISDVCSSGPSWIWPCSESILDASLLQCIDSLVILLAKFIESLSILPPSILLKYISALRC